MVAAAGFQSVKEDVRDSEARVHEEVRTSEAKLHEEIQASEARVNKGKEEVQAVNPPGWTPSWRTNPETSRPLATGQGNG